MRPTRIEITRPQSVPPLAVGLNDAARLLGISPRGLQKLVAEGKIPSALIGCRRVFRMASLEAWLASRETIADFDESEAVE